MHGNRFLLSHTGFLGNLVGRDVSHEHFGEFVLGIIGEFGDTMNGTLPTVGEILRIDLIDTFQK